MHHNPRRCHSKPGQWEPGGNRGLGDQILGGEDAAGPWTMLGRVRVWVTFETGVQKRVQCVYATWNSGLPAPEGRVGVGSRTGGLIVSKEGRW